MKILHIIPSLDKGGAERLTLDICNELAKRKEVEVILAVCRNKNDYTDLSKTLNVQFVNAFVSPSVTGKWQVNTEQLDALIKTYQPDVIHSHLFEAEMISRYNLSNAAYFTHLHDNMPQMRNFSLGTLSNKKWLTDFYEKRFITKQYRQCKNNFVAISKDAYDYFKKVLPSDLHRITLLPNAINGAKFRKPANHQRKRIADIELVNTGSFVDKKNQTFLIDVVKCLKDKGQNVHLHLLGDGENRKKLEEKTAENQLTPNISFHGNVSNVEEFLWNCDVYAHSAYYEPFGLVLVEAMAAEAPVVCLDGRGNRDIIRDGENGFMIWENNVEAFAEKILLLMKDKVLYEKIRLEGIATAAQYDIVNYIDQLLVLYKSKIKR